MGLVDEDVIDAEFVEHQPVILLVLGEQVLQPFGSRGLLLLDGLDEVAVGSLCAGVFAEQLVIFGDLLEEELLLVVPRHADPLEAAVGDDDAVPLAAGDLGGQELAAVAGQIFLGGDQQLGIGIKLHELAGELLQQVIGDDVHRLLDEAGLLHLHAGGGHREGLAGADDMGQQRVAGTHAAPDGIVLVRPQLNGLVHAGKIEVRAVEQAGTQIVVGVVVKPHQPLGAVGIGEHPGAEPLLDELLLFAGGQRRFLVDDALLAVAVSGSCRRWSATSC